MSVEQGEIDYGDAAAYTNDESIEIAWAIKAAERANIHMNLIIACDTKKLKLNKLQDEIYSTFREHFPSMDVKHITEVELKQGGMKEKWRDFSELFKETVEDYSLGSLMRMDASKGYSQENSIIVPKIIYLAIEICRNVEGMNEQLKAQYTEDHRLNGASL